MKFHIITLGCFKNTVDSELLIQALSGKCQYTHDAEEADIIIVNTCSFIQQAKEESINAILALEEKDVKLIVCGCLGQQHGKEILDEIPAVDAVTGVYAYQDMPDLFDRVEKGERIVRVREDPEPASGHPGVPRMLTPSHYSFVKISDGCSRKCSFCIIPAVKGKLRSRSMNDIVEEVKRLGEEGVKEINLVSQETTAYGIDLYGKPMLVDLLMRIQEIPGPRWIRLLYLYPGEVDDDLLSAIVEGEKVCNYLDVPIQHISDKILRSMRREVSGMNVRRSLSRIREHYPAVKMRTTLLVGFPGETDKEFTELYEFAKEMEFDRLGVFTYSREEGTISFGMDRQIPEQVKLERARSIMEMQSTISLRKNRALVGATIPVMVDEHLRGALWDGRTEFDAPEIDNGVLVEGSDEIRGEIVPVDITDATEYDLLGRHKEGGHVS